MSQVPAKEPPTQGHHQDMGTIQNTAALYLRKSSLDDRSGDNRSITDQRHIAVVLRSLKRGPNN
jgi:hypothetical protein